MRRRATADDIAIRAIVIRDQVNLQWPGPLPDQTIAALLRCVVSPFLGQRITRMEAAVRRELYGLLRKDRLEVDDRTLTYV